MPDFVQEGFRDEALSSLNQPPPPSLNFDMSSSSASTSSSSSTSNAVASCIVCLPIYLLKAIVFVLSRLLNLPTSTQSNSSLTSSSSRPSFTRRNRITSQPPSPRSFTFTPVPPPSPSPFYSSSDGSFSSDDQESEEDEDDGILYFSTPSSSRRNSTSSSSSSKFVASNTNLHSPTHHSHSHSQPTNLVKLATLHSQPKPAPAPSTPLAENPLSFTFSRPSTPTRGRSFASLSLPQEELGWEFEEEEEGLADLLLVPEVLRRLFF